MVNGTAHNKIPISGQKKCLNFTNSIEPVHHALRLGKVVGRQTRGIEVDGKAKNFKLFPSLALE
jgi:hypothetical protein